MIFIANLRHFKSPYRLRQALAICVAMACCAPILAQNNGKFEQYKNQHQQQFNSYRQNRKKEFDEYRRKCNVEFADYLRKAWSSINPSPVIEQPIEKPVPPVVRPKEDTLSVVLKPIPFDEVIPAPQPLPQPVPIKPIEETPSPIKIEMPSTMSFSFFGTPEKVRYDSKNAVRIKSVSENDIADAWLKLSGEAYDNLIYDCLQIRSDRNLCDWSYLMMLKQMSEAIYGKDTNEAVLLMAYVYCQSGYKMRLATNDGRLCMLFASNHVIYDWANFMVNGERFYPFNNKMGSYAICKQSFPNEHVMSLLIDKSQDFEMKPTAESVHQSGRNKDMRISVSANQNLLDFYTSYPSSMIGGNFMTRWAIYANMPMPRHIRESMYPQLQKAIEGCDQWTAVNRILNLIQTGFVYEYDDKVWGRDRAFFPEESLHYPYCDCEDRSILLTRIIRDLLGLKCVLIYYPGHLAAGVSFTEGNPTGDYIQYNGNRFFIADPTITGYGAPVGVTMQNMDNRSAKLILLN